ncbi:head GIN domain-containing protein [Winogradskyella maritima]|uniref:Head GIN domain-containing protein n=1 Tax=Winogradskyella maritima TaxID=1517766 RepID=A0ABV8AJB0_9FLAO|nr:head GIN domain-containing protein [Winogradskyella maritima]
MKQLKLLWICIFILNCSSKKSLDCLQTAGDIIQVSYELEDFSKITVFERTQLIISEGPKSVVLESGENLNNDISVTVANGELIIENGNACNLVRDYGITKIYVSTPTLTEIRNSSGLAVQSEGALGFPNLTLRSEDLEEEDAFHTNGDFILDLDVANLTIIQNNLSNFFLTGNVTNLNLDFIFGDARFEGRELTVQNAEIYHRGTNNIYLNAQQSVVGQLLSTGNLILTNTPPIIDVEVLYTGQLIIED